MGKGIGILIVILLAFGAGIYVTHRYMSTQSAYTMSIATNSAPVNLSVDPTPIKDPGAIADAAARVEPSVVTIDTMYRPQALFFNGDAFGMAPPRDEPLGTGSGVILTSDGTIVTNNHVVQNATKINVT